MKKNIIMLAALLVGAVSAYADDAAKSGPSLALSSSMGYESKYLFHSTQYGEGIITPSVNLFYGGFYAGTWFAIPIENEAYWSDEMDLYGGYNFVLSDLVSMDVGLIHFSYNDCVCDFLNKNNSTQANLGFNFNTLLKPSLYFTRDFDCLTYGVELKLSHSIPLGPKFSLDLGANGGSTWGEKNYTDYSFWGVKADLTYTIKPGATVSVGPRYAGSTEKYYIGSATDPDPKKSAIWYALNFAANF
jgi:uncharacterized protein (TIGR02001 family)